MSQVAPLVVGDGQVLSVLARRVVGASVQAVRYLVPSGPESIDLDSLVHEVDTVELVLGAGLTFQVRWALVGFHEGLAVNLGGEAESSDLLVALDVTNRRMWQGLVDHEITGLRVARHVSNENCPETLWALSLRMVGGSTVTFALGEVRDGVLSYMPDGLAVIFAASKAQSYTPPGCASSAWGDAVAPAGDDDDV